MDRKIEREAESSSEMKTECACTCSCRALNVCKSACGVYVCVKESWFKPG